MTKDKVIFLDIDGVMATMREWHMTHIAKTWVHMYNVYPFNPDCVKILNEIIEETDAEIILSSDWSLYFSLEQMDEIFKHNGVIKSPYDYVKQLALKLSTSKDVNRGYSIDEYIGRHSNEFNDYVIIDDLDVTSYDRGTWNNNQVVDYSKFVHCTEGDWEGIKQTGIKEKILKVLNKNI